jgi:hypothetical protein
MSALSSSSLSNSQLFQSFLPHPDYDSLLFSRPFAGFISLFWHFNSARFGPLGIIKIRLNHPLEVFQTSEWDKCQGSITANYIHKPEEMSELRRQLNAAHPQSDPPSSFDFICKVAHENNESVKSRCPRPPFFLLLIEPANRQGELKSNGHISLYELVVAFPSRRFRV